MLNSCYETKNAVLRARGKRALTDVKSHCKMTSVITLDGVKLEDFTNTCQRTCMRISSTIAGFLQCNGGKLEEAEDFNVFSSFIACSNRNRSAQARS